MIRDVVEKLMNEFPTFDVKEIFPFTGNRLAEYIRNDVPSIFAQEFADIPGIVWEASAGRGQWADAPWIAALNIAITDTPQKGYYPVLLFTSSMDGVYLSLNQGMTLLRQEFGDRDAVVKLRHNADVLRMRLGNLITENGFTCDPIDLQPRGETTRLAYYQPGHAFGKIYSRGSLPSEDIFKADISKMLRLYAISFSKGGVGDLNLDEQLIDPTPADDNEYQQKLMYKKHLSIERNQKLTKKAKEIHGYICQVCGFNFEKEYGEIGKEFIEAHHKIPLSSLTMDKFVTLSPVNDFAVLCSNCHSMIHRRNAPPTFDEFVKVYSFLSK